VENRKIATHKIETRFEQVRVQTVCGRGRFRPHVISAPPVPCPWVNPAVSWRRPHCRSNVPLRAAMHSPATDSRNHPAYVAVQSWNRPGRAGRGRRARGGAFATHGKTPEREAA